MCMNEIFHKKRNPIQLKRHCIHFLFSNLLLKRLFYKKVQNSIRIPFMCLDLSNLDHLIQGTV